MNPPPLIEHHTQMATYGRNLFRICNIEFTKTSEMQRQVSGAFLFGVANAHGMSHHLTPPDVYALTVCMLMDVLNYSTEQASAFAGDLVEATGAAPQDTMRAIIHRGIDGHRQLTRGEDEGLRQNLLGIFELLKNPYQG